MLWLDYFLWLGAVVQSLTGATVAWALAVYAARTRRHARRVAALALSLMSTALFLEAMLFLAQGPRAGELSGAALPAFALVRAMLLAAVLFMGLLVWRTRLH